MNTKSVVDYKKLQQAVTEVSESISVKKGNYCNRLAQKRSDPLTSSKTYWYILKTFHNSKKISLISPLLTDNKPGPDFKEKANHFHDFFASKCLPVNNDCTLPMPVNFN